MNWTNNDERLRASVDLALELMGTGRAALAAEILRLAAEDTTRQRRALPPLRASRGDLVAEAERLHGLMRAMLPVPAGPRRT